MKLKYSSNDFDLLKSTSFPEKVKALDAIKSGNPLPGKHQAPKLAILNATEGNISADEIYDYLGRQEKDGEVNTNGLEDTKAFPGMPGGEASALYSEAKPQVVGTGAGSVIPNSFYHKSASTQGSLPKIEIYSPEQQDLDKLFPYEAPIESFTEKLKEKLDNFLRNSNISPVKIVDNGIRDSMGKALVNSGLVGAGAGAIAGLAGNLFNNFATENAKRSTLKDMLLGALAGTAIGAAGGYMGRKDYEAANNKYAFALDSFNDNSQQHLEVVLNKIMGDNTINYTQKSDLMNYVASLGQDDIERLYKLVNTAVGAGIAYTIAKYLLNMNKTARILTTIAGAVLGYNQYTPPQYNYKPLYL